MADAAAVPSVLQPGASLRGGAYRIDALLKVESGMGELYRATHVAGRNAARALKRLRRTATTAEMAREDLGRFEQEARWLAGLSHPGIPRVYESFADEGHFFFAMDWIDGHNAEQLVEREGSFSIERCIDLATQLTNVLAYMHRHDPPLIHRDVKPANVMITPSQQATLIDFGIARRGDRALQGRADTVLFATEEYAPPEQLDPKGRTTPRSDVYALGWTLAHLLVGDRPGSAKLPKDRASLDQVLRRVIPTHYSWFAELLLRCVEVAPAKRFDDGAALAAAIQQGARSGAPPTKRVADSQAGACRSCRTPRDPSRYFCGTCGSPTFERSSHRQAEHSNRVAAKLVMPAPDSIGRHAEAVKARRTLSPRMAELSTSVARLDCTGDFEVLLCDAGLRFSPLPHQIEAATDVLRRKRGRALLADEVGLGKTIEALIVFEEYRLRGLVKKTLILTPPTLVGQWRDELVEKLRVPESDIYTIGPDDSVASVRRRIQTHAISIGNIQDLKYKAREAIFHDLEFDLVIVDEVHLILSRARSKVRPTPLRGYELIQAIRKKFILLLSATPIQTTIVDLYELVNLTRPGQLMEWSDFAEEFIAYHEERADGTKFPVLRQGPHLRDLLQKVVVRHRRDEVMTTGVFPRREARLVKIAPSAEERSLYQAVRQRLAVGGEAQKRPAVWCLDLVDALCAHPGAFVDRAQGIPALKDLVDRAKTMPEPTKLRHLVKTVEDLVRSHKRKVLIFARFPVARDVIAKELEKGKLHSFAFRKGIKDEERVELLRRFAREGDVLVVDDSAAVGLNLQFCDVVVNYDLPWNPFLIEQRVGRVQRIGQRQASVWIVNFRVQDTLDEIKLDICTARLKMFEGVFGQSPAILGAIEDDKDFDLPTLLRDIYLERNASQVRKRLDDRLADAHKRIESEGLAASEVFDKQIQWSGGD
jgi:serine/threonine protein kinase/superfamily II DNA or RNA helicase